MLGVQGSWSDAEDTGEDEGSDAGLSPELSPEWGKLWGSQGASMALPMPSLTLQPEGGHWWCAPSFTAGVPAAVEA